MADDDPDPDIEQESTDTESKPSATPQNADQYPKEPEAATSSPETDKMVRDFLQFNMDSMKRIQAREAQTDAEVAPYRAALLKEMSQPMPQMPSMSMNDQPYGAPPDPQDQRQGALSGILYGIIGLGLAKIFAGRNKSAYYGALDGLGEALRQRNAGQKEMANQSFERWLKLQELWHQQVRDRVEDYKLALENRHFSEQQKLDAIATISNMHGNHQTEAAAMRGDMQTVLKMVDHMDNMRIAQQKQADKYADNWVKSLGNTELDREYRDFLSGEGVNPYVPSEYFAAQQAPEKGKEDLRRTTWMKEHKPLTSAQQQGLEAQNKAEQEKMTDDQIKEMIANPAGGKTPAPASPNPPTGILPESPVPQLPGAD